jgi:competence protein ComEC
MKEQLRRRVHVSWLVAWLSVGIILGVVSAQYIPSTWFYSVAWLLDGVALATFGLWRRRQYVILVVLVAGGLIGLWRGSISQQALLPYEHLIGKTAVVEGVVSEDVDIGKNGELVFRLRDIAIDGNPCAGEVWVSVSENTDVKRSDFVRVSGKLAEGFGNFSASIYRGALEGVRRPNPGDVALRVRDDFAEKVRKVVAEPEASLGIGFLVGQRRSLPPELDEALRIAGLMHVVVASGYNLTILVRLARRLFVKVSKYLATFVSGVMIIGFIAVTGASPSMSRAGLVTGLSLLAWYYGRRFHPLVLLPFVAALTLLVNPSYGWNNLGWQLSFAAFAGVMIFAPLAQAYFFGKKKPGTLRQILGETISAQTVTLPILIVAFGEFSNVAIVANILVLPLVPLAMLLTFVAGVSVPLLPGIAASFLGSLAEWLLRYMTTIAESLAKLPWAQTTLSADWRFAMFYYAAIVAACLYMWRRTKYSLRDSSIVE